MRVESIGVTNGRGLPPRAILVQQRMAVSGVLQRPYHADPVYLERVLLCGVTDDALPLR